MKLPFPWLLIMLLVLGCSEKKPKEAEKIAKTPQAIVTSPPPVINEGSIRLERLRELVRHPNSEQSDQLKRLLSAGSTERIWASFGLGLNCTGSESEKIHGLLVSAVAAWASETQGPDADLLRTVAWAIGNCAAPQAEDLLRSWLAFDPSTRAEGFIEAAAYGLGALVDRKGALTEQTQAAVLDAAAREKRGELLFPLGRMGRLSESVGAHVLEVASALLTSERKPGRREAILALGSAGASAAAPLAEVLLGKAFSASERAAAAQALGRLGDPGQESLDQSLATMLERGLPLSFDRELWIPLRATLNALNQPKLSKSALKELRSIVLSEGSDPKKLVQRRRYIWLRCRAADLLADDQYESQALVTCAPEPTREAHLARLRVIGRGPFTGPRKQAFLRSLQSTDPVVAQSALRLIPSHPELKESDALLIEALQIDQPGTQATAAQIVAAYPSRALKEDSGVGQNEALLAAIEKLLKDESKKLPLETRAAAIKAAGALQALSLKPSVETLCNSELEALWAPSARALSLLGGSEAHCPKETPPKDIQTTPSGNNPTAAIKDGANRGEESENELASVTLVIDSDVGQLQLHLDDTSAPASRQRFLALVDEGFYNNISIHGESPGFAIQFGDKNGDGYDETFTSPLPHEVTWTPFSSLSFGMSAFSEGSQNSQIFVVLSDAPQLTGSRVRLGMAEGPWHLLAVGDVLHSVKRASKTKK